MFKKHSIYRLLTTVTGIMFCFNLNINATEETSITVPTITAETAIVYDIESDSVLYDKNMNQKMYPASITKLMTAMLTIDTLKPTDPVLYSEEAVNGFEYNSSRIGIRVGEEITVDQSLHGLLLMSANETANALAEACDGSVKAFAKRMTDKAVKLGAVNTNFTNPHGLHDDEHYTTAYDMALITEEVIKSDYFLEIMTHSMYQIPPTNKCDVPRDLAQHHKMLNNKKDMRIYRDDVFAGKAGYTTDAGHTLVTVASNNERTLIVVIMKTNANNLYKDTAKLIDYGYLAPIPEKVEEPEETVQASSIDSATSEGPKGTVIDKTKDQTDTQSDLILLKDDEITNEKSSSKKINIGSILLKLLLTVVIVGSIGFGGFILYQREQRRQQRLKEIRNKMHERRYQ